MMTVSMPLWAYIMLLAYSLVFSVLFVVALAARDREKREHENTKQRMGAERDYWLWRYMNTRRKKNDSNKL